MALLKLLVLWLLKMTGSMALLKLLVLWLFLNYWLLSNCWPPTTKYWTLTTIGHLLLSTGHLLLLDMFSV